MTPEPTMVFAAAIVLGTILTAACDIRWNRIPNSFTVPIFLAAVVYHGITSGLSGAAMSLLGFALGMGLLLIPWMFGGGGAGDVKLMAAVGAWFGPKLILLVWMGSMGVALLMAICVLSYVAMTRGSAQMRSKFLSQNDADAARSGKPPVRKRVIPYAVPVAVASWAILAYLMLQHPGS
jgi:prepilin peptidase CpaA